MNLTTQSVTTELLNRLANNAGTAAPDVIRARAVLTQLPTVYSNLLYQRYVQGRSAAEIARQCDCPEASVIQWLERAHEVFTRRLGTRPRPSKRTTRNHNTGADNDQLLQISKTNDGLADPSSF